MTVQPNVGDTSSSRSAYIHTPLNFKRKQIRLIKTLSWVCNEEEGKEELHCAIMTVDLESEPTYTALSYAWGDPGIQHHVYVDGYALAVTTNLYAFLTHHVESCRHDYWLWIDQISIDQANILERNHQVSLMGLIYCSAVQGLHWLGKGDRTLHEAIDVLNSSPIQSYSSPDQFPLNAGHIQSILNNEYWSRLWIIQELYLSLDRLIVCGNKSVELEKLHHAFMNYLGFQNLLRCKRVDYDHLDKCLNLLHTLSLVRPVLLTWPDVIPAIKHAKCSDIRDRIFGVQAMILPEHEIKVDYNLTSEQLYLRVLWADCLHGHCARSSSLRDLLKIILWIYFDWLVPTATQPYVRFVVALEAALDVSYTVELRSYVRTILLRSWRNGVRLNYENSKSRATSVMAKLNFVHKRQGASAP